MENYFTIDEQPIPFTPGQTILEACKSAEFISRICAIIRSLLRTAVASSAR